MPAKKTKKTAKKAAKKSVTKKVARKTAKKTTRKYTKRAVKSKVVPVTPSRGTTTVAAALEAYFTPTGEINPAVLASAPTVNVIEGC